MAKPSEPDDRLAGLLGLGNHSLRKSHYPELAARLAELESEKIRYTRLNDELEQRVAERTLQLQEARDAAEAANRSKDKYLAAASHDLLQPLNAARLLISSLRERTLPAAEQHLVERAHLALEGAEDLLTDLLDIARMDQVGVRPQRELVSLAQVFEPLASEFEPVAAARGLRLRVRMNTRTVFCDGRLLTRILRNFLSNACRYTDQGCVLLCARRRGNTMRLEVRDSGRGIAADQLDSIFLEFNQLDPQGERRGVGLGLAIVDRIAKALECPVLVRSRPGIGSVFAIDIPLIECPEPVMAVQARLSILGDPLPGRRLLVIDNEADIRLGMTGLLCGWGCEVLAVADAEQALQAWCGPPPDLILADYHLDARQTGAAALARLRAAFGVDVPAVIVSADRSDEVLGAAHAMGAGYLDKPVRPGKLRALVSRLIAER